MKKIVIPLLLILAACTTKPIVPQPKEYPPGIISCVHKHDLKLDFQYDPKNAAQWYNEQYRVSIYLIDLEDGGQIAINRKSFEEMTESISEEYGEACYTRDELTELLGEYMALVESEKQALHAIEMGSDKDDGEIRKLLLELQLKLELINNTDSYVTKLLRKRCCGSDIDTWNHPLTWIVGFLSSSSSSSDRGYITGAFVRNNDLMTNPNITTKELMDSYMLLYVFDSLRKQFVPTGHEGSQAGITEVNKRFAEVYQKRIDEYYEEYGEEED